MSVGALKRKPANTGDGMPLHQEHQLLIREVAALQSRVTDMVRAHRASRRTLEAEILRLQAHNMVDRTQRLWALPERPPTHRDHSAPTHEAEHQKASAWQAADAVLCQTGCVCHAHAWLQADGGCSRTGRVCTDVLPTPSTHTRHGAEPDLTSSGLPYAEARQVRAARVRDASRWGCT